MISININVHWKNMYNNSRETMELNLYVTYQGHHKANGENRKSAKNYTRRYFVIIFSRRSIGRSHSNLTIFVVSKICLSSFERNIVGGIPKWNSVMSIHFFSSFLFRLILIVFFSLLNI